MSDGLVWNFDDQQKAMIARTVDRLERACAETWPRDEIAGLYADLLVMDRTARDLFLVEEPVDWRAVNQLVINHAGPHFLDRHVKGKAWEMVARVEVEATRARNHHLSRSSKERER